MHYRTRSMKRLAALAATGWLATTAAFAQSTATPPTITILSPTSAATLFSASFPFTQTVSFKVAHPEMLTKVQVLDVSVNNVTIINGGSPLGNPFGSSGLCATALSTAPNTCVNASAYEATVGVPWTVPAPGQYSLLVSARYKGAEGSDQETILVLQTSVEYPAPPAVANAYINGDAYLKTLSGKKRGCIIAKVAEQHAQYSAYGPKGGPYDEPAIRAATLSFSSACL
jgi:hypothetical protein